MTQEEADERNARWRSLSPAEQLKELDYKFVKDKRATKQRKKIAEKIRKG